MRRVLLMLAGLAVLATSASAQTAEEIVNKYIKTVGGADKIQAVKTLRRSGKFTGGGGFEGAIVEENKRANMVRQEFSLQGLTAVNAYDGKTGWKIEPWEGKKDAEPLGEEEVKLTKRAYGWPEDAKFLVPDGVYERFAAGVGARGARRDRLLPGAASRPLRPRRS